MSSDVFIISSARDPNPVTAIRQAVELAGVAPARIQDAVFCLEPAATFPDFDSITRSVGLTCPSAAISPGLRALSFCAASILSDEAELAVATGLGPYGCAAIVLASPEAVGRLNLLPRARLAARSLRGAEPALRMAGNTSSDVQIWRDGDSLVLVHDLLAELESQAAQWGLISSADMALLIERI